MKKLEDFIYMNAKLISTILIIGIFLLSKSVAAEENNFAFSLSSTQQWVGADFVFAGKTIFKNIRIEFDFYFN